jgi:GT2 family glycosyltransferase
MSEEYQITVSIVLFNTDKKEIVSLLGILAQTSLRMKIYLIDNSPIAEDRGSYAGYSNVEYIFTGKNLGFGAGHNIAIAKAAANSEFHLILNSDINFEPEILNEIYAYMKSNNEIGMLGPKVYNPDGSLQYTAKLLPTPYILFFRRFLPLDIVASKSDDRFELRGFDLDQTIEVPFLLGCFLFVNTKVFENVHGFDERFFMYMEDVDLSRRISENFRTVYYPAVSINHAHGRGSYENRKLLRYHIRSAIRYFNKWGWFFDKRRRQLNNKTLSQFG